MLIFKLIFKKLIYQNLLVIFGNNETDHHSKGFIFFYTLIQLIENVGLSTEFHQCVATSKSEMLTPDVSHTIISVRLENCLFHTQFWI